jgi:hypothetical protein
VENYPVLQVIGGVIYLIVAVLWMWFFIRRGDPWLRERVGRRFGVKLGINARGMWTIAGKEQGFVRGLLIEFLQPLFWIPAILLPLTGFIIGLMLLGQG